VSFILVKQKFNGYLCLAHAVVIFGKLLDATIIANITVLSPILSVGLVI